MFLFFFPVQKLFSKLHLFVDHELFDLPPSPLETINQSWENQTYRFPCAPFRFLTRTCSSFQHPDPTAKYSMAQTKDGDLSRPSALPVIIASLFCYQLTNCRTTETRVRQRQFRLLQSQFLPGSRPELQCHHNEIADERWVFCRSLYNQTHFDKQQFL